MALISLFRGILVSRQVQVEYINEGTVNGFSTKMILVDVEGGVVNSGVYELRNGSRIKDVLISAGGLSENADRIFCEKNINMAEEVKDGQKIYIPRTTSTDAEKGYFEANVQSKKVSINTATVTELDTLWGVGESRAESIVKNRPYQSIEDLISRGVLTKSIVDKNRELLSVY